MTYDEVVAYLTLAIDHYVNPDPNDPNVVEVVDGAAGEGNEVVAERLLARLVAAKERLDRSPGGVAAAQAALNALDTACAARLASWTASRSTLFTQLDRDTRVIEQLIIAAATPNPTPPPDYLDLQVDAMDPTIPGDLGDPAAAILRAGTAYDVGKRYGIDANILAGLAEASRLFDTEPPTEDPRPRWNATAALRSAQSFAATSEIGYTAAFTAAATFVTYLQSTPP